MTLGLTCRLQVDGIIEDVRQGRWISGMQANALVSAEVQVAGCTICVEPADWLNPGRTV